MELKVAPRRTIINRIKIHGSSLIYSTVLTVVILFIAALVSSAIGGNIYLFFTDELKISDKIYSILTFPTLLPIALLFLGVMVLMLSIPLKFSPATISRPSPTLSSNK